MRLTLLLLFALSARIQASGFVTASGGQFSLNGRAVSLVEGPQLIHVNLGSLPPSEFPGVPSEVGLRQLDKILADARKSGKLVMLSLASGKEKGSVQRTAQVLGGRGQGLFYVDGRAREWFLYLIRAAAGRVNTVNATPYAKEPALAGWILGEWMNDPDDPEGERVTGWAKQAGGLLQTLDRNHLVGMSWLGQGAPKFNRLAAIDFLAVPPAEVKNAALASGKPVLAWGPGSQDPLEPLAAAGSLGAQEGLALTGTAHLALGPARILPLSDSEVLLSFDLSSEALPSVDWGTDGLLDRSSKGRAGRKARVRIKGLKGGRAYLFRPRALSRDGKSGSGPMLEYANPPLKQRLARPQKASQNIIRARAGSFWDGPVRFRFSGANNYYLRDLDDPARRAEILDAARDMGMRVLRLHASAESPQQAKGPFFVAGSPMGFQEAQFARFDQVMQECAARGLRLILSFTDNWEYFGGTAVWAGWRGQKKWAFFTNPRVRQDYKALVRQWVLRKNSVSGRLYRQDPALLAWELCNDARFENDPSGATLAGWIAEMASYVKSLDPNHLVGTGIEGHMNDNGGHPSGADFKLAHQSAAVDYCSLHLYPLAADRRFSLATTKALIKEALRVSKEELKKPLVMGEFGLPRSGEQGRRDIDPLEWTRAMAKAFSDGGGDGLACWMLADAGFEGDGMEFNRGNTDTFNLFSELSDGLNP